MSCAIRSGDLDTSRVAHRTLITRALALSLLCALELIVISVQLDGDSLARASGLAAVIRNWGPYILRAIVGFAAIYATFVWLKHTTALKRISTALTGAPIQWTLLASHFITIAAFAALSARLYGGARASSWLATGWLIVGALALVQAALAFIPWAQWWQLAASGGWLWIYTALAILLVSSAGNISRTLWQPASQLTFALAKLFLKPFVSGIVAKPAELILGTTRFQVMISPECSGLEGAGLMLAFGIMWLVLFRHECRFPQSLALIPAGIGVLFLLNGVRIAALVLIGDAGAPQIAAGGFHSQAGWILFNAVAVGFCVSIRRVAWFSTRPLGTSTQEQAREWNPLSAENPTFVYLMPLMAILIAGMISTAASGGFEWLYPLRLVAAAAVLFLFRKKYGRLNFSSDWLAPIMGVAVFVIWVAVDWAMKIRVHNHGFDPGMPSALMASTRARAVWIACRVIAAIVTVPLAEELAFRGFLMRRFISEDFESVSFHCTTWFAVIGSSVAFGLLHGGQWISGILAGVIFSLLVKRGDRIGDAVVAHSTANALLAGYVLVCGQWHFW